MSDAAPIVFAPMFNTRGRKDATGAFQPEADAFCRARGGASTLIANTMPAEAMRAQVFLRLMHDPAIQIRTVAFFCHGSGGSIQFGFNRANVGELAASLANLGVERVVLYCCNTAKGAKAEAEMAEFGGDGGFADALRDALCRAGAVNCQVDAHTTAGHTTRNPFVRRFLGMGSRVGGVGGFWIVSPTNRPLWAKWRRALREGSLRFDFPFLSIADPRAVDGCLMPTDRERERTYREYLAQQQAEREQEQVQQQPSTGRFPVLERAVQIVPVDRPVCDHHRDIEDRMRAVERAQIMWEAKFKPLWFLIAAAGGGLVTAGIAWALARLGG